MDDLLAIGWAPPGLEIWAAHMRAHARTPAYIRAFGPVIFSGSNKQRHRSRTHVIVAKLGSTTIDLRCTGRPAQKLRRHERCARAEVNRQRFVFAVARN